MASTDICYDCGNFEADCLCSTDVADLAIYLQKHKDDMYSIWVKMVHARGGLDPSVMCLARTLRLLQEVIDIERNKP